jgi:ribonuclease HI
MLTVYTDGGCSGNPGPMFIAGVVLEKDIVIQSFSDSIGAGTNNIAEYSAMEYAMDYLIENEFTGPVEFITDSKLVVMQMTGKWACKGHLLTQCMRMQEKRQKLRPCQFTHVKREHPWIQEVDRMVKEKALEYRIENSQSGAIEEW